MSTSSFIGIIGPDSVISGVYCHYDGYPEGVGQTLTDNYKTTESVNTLLALGDLSSLGTSLEECEAYHRDRGDEMSEPIVFTDHNDMMNNVWKELGAEYAYVWDGTGWSAHSTFNS